MPGCWEAFGHKSVFDLYWPQVEWLITMWNKEQKVKEREYKKLRKKK